MNLGRLRSITIETDATATTTEPTFSADYIDYGAAGMALGGSEGSLTGTAAVSAVGAPDADVEHRQVTGLAVYNADTVSRTITINKHVVATSYPLIVQVLAAGETLVYANEAWSVLSRNVSGAVPIAGSGGYTTSRETNIAGLSSALTLANELRTDLIAHLANATRHTTGQQSSAALPAAATTLTTLLALCAAELTLYAAHNVDAVKASAWSYHTAQTAAKALSSAVAPVSLQEAITKLNDLKAKYNDHEDETTGHADVASVTADQTAAADAAYSTAIRVPVTGALAGDVCQWAILNDGTGNATGVSATAGAGFVDFTFSADPQNDAIISYMVSRIAV